MSLIRTKYNCFLFLITFIQKNVYPLCFTFDYFDVSVKILLFIQPASFYFTLYNGIITCVHIIIKRCFNAFHLKRSKESIINTILKRIYINRIAKISVSINISIPLGSSGKSQLHSRTKIFHNLSPITFIICTAAVTLINNNKIEKVLWIISKIRSGIANFISSTHKGLENSKEDTPVSRNLPLLSYFVRLNSYHCIIRKSRKSIISLISKNVPVGKK